MERLNRSQAIGQYLALSWPAIHCSLTLTAQMMHYYSMEMHQDGAQTYRSSKHREYAL